MQASLKLEENATEDTIHRPGGGMRMDLMPPRNPDSRVVGA